MKNFKLVFISTLVLLTTSVFAETPAETPADTKMTLATNAFLDKMATPTLYTCDGKDVSPQLSWSDAPNKTAAFAIVMSDLDAPNQPFYHWVVYNIPKSTFELTQGTAVPNGAASVKNSHNKSGYTGPCPAKGDAHTYTITLYALDTKLSVPKDADGTAVLNAMKGHIVGEATLTTIYSRWIE